MYINYANWVQYPNLCTHTHIYMHTQRELKLLNSKPEFAQLLGHCQEKCDGMKLTELLQLPADRVSQSTVAIGTRSSVLDCVTCTYRSSVVA